MNAKRKFINVTMKILVSASALFAVLVLIGIFSMLFGNGIKTFREVSFSEFFGSTNWNPGSYTQPSYGILGLVWSTIMLSAGAMVIAIPLGIATATYISEFAQGKVKTILKSTIEILAGIPSVVVGFVGLELIAPFLQKVFHLDNSFTALNGSILLAIMALPTIVSLSEDAIRSVAYSFKEASYGLGATKWQTITKITLPAARAGIISACVLGFGRAIGETMTVLMVTGNAAAFTTNFFAPVRTMTATIAIELGEVAYDTTHYYSLFAVGSVLFLMSLLFNFIAEKVASHYRIKGI